MFLCTELFIVLMNCLLLSHGLGLSAVYQCLQQRHNLLRLGMWLTILCSIGSVLTTQLTRLLHLSTVPLLLPLVYLLVEGMLYLGALLLLHFLQKRFARCPSHLADTLHPAALSSAVLGTYFWVVERAQTIAESLRWGIRSGLGFLLACGIIALVYPTLNNSKTPASMRGWPALLLYLGILSMGVSCLQSVL